MFTSELPQPWAQTNGGVQGGVWDKLYEGVLDKSSNAVCPRLMHAQFYQCIDHVLEAIIVGIAICTAQTQGERQ